MPDPNPRESIDKVQELQNKPLYKPSIKDFHPNIKNCKMCGLKDIKTTVNKKNKFSNKFCSCKRESLLPFSALDIDPKTKFVPKKRLATAKKRRPGKSSEKEDDKPKETEEEASFISYKASTFRPLTSEPFHKRFVKHTRRGVPVYKFSATKVGIGLNINSHWKTIILQMSKT